MNANDLKSVLSDCCNDITFRYKGKKCGIFPTVDNYQPNYNTWYGDKHQNFYDADALMTAPFFDGKSLSEISNQVDVQFY